MQLMTPVSDNFPQVGQILDCTISATSNEQIVITPQRNGTTYTALTGDFVVDIYGTVNSNGGLTQKLKHTPPLQFPSTGSDIKDSGTILVKFCK